jgi:hypothetical protein
MEPGTPKRRPTGMRSIALLVAALLVPLALAGCGSDDGRVVATDPAATTTPASRAPTASPTPSPTVGSYPEFAPSDYTFQLTVQCFCAGAGSPVSVVVADSQVVGTGDSLHGLSINDIIARANDTSADTVKVDWPAGQDYPTSVYVDRRKEVADDEIGYTIGDVEIAS